MSTASPTAHTAGTGPTATVPTLRTLLDGRRQEGRTFSPDEAVAVIVPLCLDLKERHERGERLHVHPSSVAPGADGLARLAPALARAAADPRDRACMAPELRRTHQPGDARASVFAVGAMLYEMLIGEAVGPGMRRPRDIDPSVPAHMEELIAKCLVSDSAHRPDDLGALASAMYHVAPAKSIHPPEVSERVLDESAQMDVDVSLSLVPPPSMTPGAPGGAFGTAAQVVIPPSTRLPSAQSVGAGGAAFTDPLAPTLIQHPPPAGITNPTRELAELKARLEADPRPRYVVNKDRMDHGPFTAVELLQQIASHQFVAEHGLRDELSGQSLPIGEWPEFAPFAEQAGLHRQITEEKKEVAKVVQAEKKAGVAKLAIGATVVLVLGGALAAWVVAKRGERSDEVSVSDDPSVAGVDVSGNIKGGKRGGGGGRGGAGGGGGGGPGGMSYEAAIASNNEQIQMGAKTGPDLSDAQLAAPMKNAAFIDACGAPSNMKVTVKVAVKMGRAVGVSVYTNPSQPSVASCIDRHVRGLSWPSNPKMDSFTTSY
jgi:hypothetical protein